MSKNNFVFPHSYVRIEISSQAEKAHSLVAPHLAAGLVGFAQRRSLENFCYLTHSVVSVEGSIKKLISYCI